MEAEAGQTGRREPGDTVREAGRGERRSLRRRSPKRRLRRSQLLPPQAEVHGFPPPKPRVTTIPPPPAASRGPTLPAPRAKVRTPAASFPVDPGFGIQP